MASGQATLARLRAEAAGCRACELWKLGSQTVFGEGAARTDLMLVGEQPGDREDREGRPFVGPAGGLLLAALAEADIDRDDVYLTNAVKHFRWRPSGTRRIHDKPGRRHVEACLPWLVAEIGAVDPKVVVALGATAAQALLGSDFKLTAARGEPRQADVGVPVLATFHPSAVLRARDDARDELRALLVQDLEHARELAAGAPRRRRTPRAERAATRRT